MNSSANSPSPAIQAAPTVSTSIESPSVTDTRNPTIPPPPPPSGGALTASPPLRLPSRYRVWAIPLAVVGFIVPILVALAAALPAELVAEQENPRLGVLEPAPYARTPSSAQPVNDRVRLGDLPDDLAQFPPDASVFFVTVTEPRQSILSWWVGRDEPAIEFLTEEQRYGIQTPEQRRVFALESMRTSEQVAQFVALGRLGFEVEVVPGDVLVQQLVCLETSEDGQTCVRETPSAAVLEPGDRLIEADGVVLEGVEDLSRVVGAKRPGDTVELVIDRPRTGEFTADVELTSSPTDPDRTIVGFVPFDTRRVVLPFELSIDTGRIGGPSAGLAFTLTLIDQLTPGELTGGRDIAVTGTMELDGTVGAIGGLRQKASAVAQAGVEIFLVPSAQREDDIEAARVAAGDRVEIIPVGTLDEALDVLARFGGGSALLDG